MLCSFHFVKDYKHLVKLFQCSVTLCTNHRGSSTQQERERHTHTLCLCVINCQEESLAAWGSGPNSVVLAGPVSRHCLRFWLPTRRFSSSATTGMGENSPTTYTLQGSSLKTWVNMYVFYYLIFLFFTNVCNLLQAQGEKSSGQSHEISFS